jgi:hypothetical protein
MKTFKVASGYALRVNREVVQVLQGEFVHTTFDEEGAREMNLKRAAYYLMMLSTCSIS